MGVETILLVEDDDMVRKLTYRFLDENGYRVLEARHGQEALAIYAQYHEPISLLLTDVVMPGMSGKDLAEQLIDICPELKVVYMSGYTDSAIEHHGILKQSIVFLQKPFSANTLTCKVREVLDTL